MPIYHDTRKRRFRFQFNRVIRGRRYRASRLLPAGWSRSQAEKYDREEISRLYALASGVEQREPLISEAVAVYLDHRLPQLRDRKNIARELSYMVPTIRGKTLAELPDVARDYTKKHADLAPATVRNRLAYLRSAVKYAWKHHGMGDRDHSSRMALPRVNNARQVYAQRDELRELLAAVRRPDTRALVRIVFFTGLRWRKEVLPLQPEDVLRDGKQLWFAIADTKTGKPRMVPVHPAVRADLKWLPFSRAWRNYYEEFKEAAAAIGRPELWMHDLRRSLASVLLSGGSSLREVGEVLGHKSAQATERYAYLYPSALVGVYNRVPNLSRTASKKRK